MLKFRYSDKKLAFHWAVPALLVGLLATPDAFAGDGSPGDTLAGEAAAHAVQAQPGTATPVTAAKLPLGAPILGAAQIKILTDIQARGPLPGPGMAQFGPPAGPTAGSQTTPDGVGPQPQIPSTFRLFASSSPNSVIPAANKSTIDEPSTAMSGRVRFMTGNWYAAFSNNGGTNWTHLSPFTAFPSADGGFCCDQVSLYDPSRDMVIWLLQYIKSGSTAADRGRFRIALFRNTQNNISPAGWIFYDFLPSGLGGPASGEWFDYPHLALSNDYLYVAINVFTTTTNSWTRTVMARLPLDQLSAGAGLSFNFLSWTANFNFTPVQGAKDTMYWASHQTTNTIRIFRWPETATTASFFDRTIPAWTSTTRGSSSCPTSDGQNWCLRTDDRILAGARSWNNATSLSELMFFWNVKQGGAFPRPYIEATKLRESDLVVTGRPFFWNANFPFHYVAAAPNARGDVGLSLFWGHPSFGFAPSTLACIDDDFNGAPPGWECLALRNGTNGPSNNGWGDYVAVRPAHPATFGWQATSFTLQGGKTGNFVEPLNFIFGRERDLNEYLRWWNR